MKKIKFNIHSPKIVDGNCRVLQNKIKQYKIQVYTTIGFFGSYDWHDCVIYDKQILCGKKVAQPSVFHYFDDAVNAINEHNIFINKSTITEEWIRVYGNSN